MFTSSCRISIIRGALKYVSVGIGVSSVISSVTGATFSMLLVSVVDSDTRTIAGLSAEFSCLSVVEKSYVNSCFLLASVVKLAAATIVSVADSLSCGSGSADDDSDSVDLILTDAVCCSE